MDLNPRLNIWEYVQSKQFDSNCNCLKHYKSLGGKHNGYENIKLKTTLSRWGELIKECRNVGKPVRTWCAENQISPGKYYYWLKVLRNEVLINSSNNSDLPVPRFTEVKIAAASNNKVSQRLDIGTADDNSNNICATVKVSSFSLQISKICIWYSKSGPFFQLILIENWSTILI